MHITSFRVKNFRRLKDTRIDLEAESTVFVGSNNSGKTSATHLFQLFVGPQQRAPFQIYDFTADCWEDFNSFDAEVGDPDLDLPKITLDLWLEVDDQNLHRVVDLLPDLEWDGEPVAIRMVYAPRDGKQLLANYSEAVAHAESATTDDTASFKAWPQTLVQYLDKRLQQEYEVKYFVMDAKRCSEDLQPDADYEPFFLGTHASGASAIVESIVRVDFLSAQRHLSDLDGRGRSEDLSKRLSRFYERNLQKIDNDLEAMTAIAESEVRLNEHFAEVFKPTFERLSAIGYPGGANPDLMVKASFDAYSILNSSAKVHYAMPASDATGSAIEQTLPDQYNGLGFKNLIYMVVEILDAHHAWADTDDDRPPIHLVMIEEPEAHLHTQLQQVFIRQLWEILPAIEDSFRTQIVVTTHSPHIIYESSFKPIRYFSRFETPQCLQLSEVRNLSKFHRDEEAATREFLQQYIKLTHCDLFFADAAVLVEGNVERLLLPLIIERHVAELRSCHLTILEVGGAFAHIFESLLSFLALPTLVVTDLDSVASSDTTEENDTSSTPSACPVHTPGAITSNETLKQWLPRMTSISELLAATPAEKAPRASDGSEGLVRVAYQTLQQVEWGGSVEERAGRTLEEAFALQNLVWSQSSEGKHLGLKIPDSEGLELEQLHQQLFKRVGGLDKTNFALGVIAATGMDWQAPHYIVDGLEWLLSRLRSTTPNKNNLPQPGIGE